VKGTDADWTAKVWAAYLAVALPDEDITSRPEKDKNQDQIDVDRDDLGNQGQNKLGEWTYFQGEDGNYYRYKTEGGDKDSAVKVDKAEYDLYMEALAAAAAAEDEGLGIWLWVIIGAAVLVVLGAGAVVLIIVLKKKNKNVATDDVAGFVEIIDEEATAPAEEAAAPEAKTEEYFLTINKKGRASHVLFYRNGKATRAAGGFLSFQSSLSLSRHARQMRLLSNSTLSSVLPQNRQEGWNLRSTMLSFSTWISK
jgi:hypothetical protein